MTTKTKTSKPAVAKKPTTKTAAAPAPAPKPKPEAAPAPAPKAKAKAKVETAPTYKPTVLALVMAKGKPTVLVGKRRIDAHEGEVLDRAQRFWSQLKYVRVAKDKGGKLHITTAREAAAKGLEIL